MIEGLRRSKVLTLPSRPNRPGRRVKLRGDALKWLLIALIAWLISGILRAEEFNLDEALARMEASAHGYVPTVSLELNTQESTPEPGWFSFDRHWTSFKSHLGSIVQHLKVKPPTVDGDGPALVEFIRRNIYSEEEAGLLFRKKLLYGERSIAHVRAGYGLFFGPSTVPTTRPCVGGEHEDRWFYVKATFHF